MLGFLALVAAWAVLGVVLSRWHHSVYWPRDRQSPSPQLARCVSVLFWTHRLVPMALLVALALHDHSKPEPWIVQQLSFSLLFGSTLLMFCFDALLGCLRLRWQWRAGGGDPRSLSCRETLDAVFPHLRFVVVFILEMLWFLKPFIHLGHLVYKGLQTERLYDLPHLEEGALKQELLAISKGYGRCPERVLVGPDALSFKDLKKDIVVSSEKLSALPPSTITADFAVRNVPFVSCGSPTSAKSEERVYGLGCVFSLLVALAYVFSVRYPFRIPEKGAPEIVWWKLYGAMAGAAVLYIATVMVVGCCFGKKKCADFGIRNRYADAFELWRSLGNQSELTGERRVEDFVAALAESRSFQNKTNDPVLIVNQLGLDSDLQQFMLHQPDTTPERCFEHAAQYLAQRSTKS